MADNMKNEFQQLVKTMVEEISEKIFVAQLEDIYHDFSKQLEDYEKAVDCGRKAGNEIIKCAENNQTSIQKLEKNVNKELVQIKKTIQDITAEYSKVFDSFSQKVTSLNSSERESFLDGLRETIDQKENELIGDLNIKYKDIFGEFSQNVSRLNEKERKAFLSEIDKILNKFSEEIEDMIHQQQNSIKRDCESIEEHVITMAKILFAMKKKTEEQQEENANAIASIMDRQKEYMDKMEQIIDRQENLMKTMLEMQN